MRTVRVWLGLPMTRTGGLEEEEEYTAPCGHVSRRTLVTMPTFSGGGSVMPPGSSCGRLMVVCLT